MIAVQRKEMSDPTSVSRVCEMERVCSSKTTRTMYSTIHQVQRRQLTWRYLWPLESIKMGDPKEERRVLVVFT